MLKRLLITFLFLSLTSIAHAADTKEIWITPEASDYSRLATGLAGSNITIISSDEIVKSAEKDITEKTDEYTNQFANPFIASSRGFIDDVIKPQSTRKRIAVALDNLQNKELTSPYKKHDNIPL